MKLRLFFVSLFLLILFSACNGKGTTDITGKWQTEYTVKTGFSESKDTDALDVFFNVKQKINYEFLSDGKYTKNVVQKLESVENPNEIALPSFNEIAKDIDNSLTIFGTYEVKNGKINFLANEIMLSDGTQYLYEDYQELNSFIDPSETLDVFTLKDGVLTISDFKYKKL